MLLITDFKLMKEQMLNSKYPSKINLSKALK